MWMVACFVADRRRRSRRQIYRSTELVSGALRPFDLERRRWLRSPSDLAARWWGPRPFHGARWPVLGGEPRVWRPFLDEAPRGPPSFSSVALGVAESLPADRTSPPLRLRRHRWLRLAATAAQPQLAAEYRP